MSHSGRLAVPSLRNRLQLCIERLDVGLNGLELATVEAPGDAEAERQHRVLTGDRTVRLDIARDVDVRRETGGHSASLGGIGSSTMTGSASGAGTSHAKANQGLMIGAEMQVT